MKKILFFGVLVAALGLSSCGGGAGVKPAQNGLDSLFSQSQADTLTIITAEINGWQNGRQFERAMAADSSLSKDQFLRGLRYVFSADTATSFSYGMITALNLNAQLRQWEQMGLSVNRDLFLRKFVAAFTDSLPENYINELQATNYRLNNQLREALRVYERNKIELSPESQANIARGIAYIDSLRKADSNVEVAASGVAYRIENAGSEPKVGPTDMIKTVFTGRTLDGRVIDRVDPASPRTIAVATRVEGLKEALYNLGAGGKATVYVPGKLAFGVDNMRRYNLGPNEMVVYDIEVLNIEPTK